MTKEKYKLTQFEYDLFNICADGWSCEDEFKEDRVLMNMKKLGYFKDIDVNMTMCEIAGNCEVI